MPDLILLDYYMPDLKGSEVTKELRSYEETKSIPIIVVSTSTKNEDIESCFQAGANDYLTKPIQPEVVLARAANLLAVPHREHRRLPVNFQIGGEAPALTFTGFSRNLSQSGISVEAEQSLEAGVRLKLWLPVAQNQGMIEINGEVVRGEMDKKRAKYVYGIKFLGMTPQAESALTEFLQKHLPEPEPIY